ncbi:MAG TPA: hypothetical protein VGP07_21740 [Polyangia bacterium]
MTRSDHRSGPSRGIVFALLAAGLTLLVAPQAFAKKKAPAAAAPAGTDDETPKTGDAAAAEKPATQANDEEKPKAALNLEQEAPKTDSLGHVHFASPNGEGLGRVVVNAPAASKVKIFLEGRLFGTAPVTIYSVPKGDYIVEAVDPSGKSLPSKPVTVSEGEETTVDFGGKAAAAGGSGDSGFSGGEMTSTRKTLMWSFVGGAVVGIVVGTVFGILDVQAENDYKNTPSNEQQQLDSIQQRGQRDAAIADAGWILAAVGAVGAAVCAFPLIFGGNEKASTAPAASGTPSAFMFSPVAGPHLTGGAFTMRF